jgi:hypothetical protein
MRWRSLAAIPLAVAVGCAGPDPTATTTLTPTGAASADASQIALGELVAGRYTHANFTPRIEVEVPTGGWLTYHLSPDFFDVAIETEEGPVAIMFLRPQGFVTPHGEFEPSSAEEAIGLLGHHEGVTVSDSRPVEVDGVAGLEVDVTLDVDNTHVYRVADGLIGFGPQTDVRLAYLEADAGLLVIGLNFPAGTMQQAEELAEPVIESIQIGP